MKRLMFLIQCMHVRICVYTILGSLARCSPKCIHSRSNRMFSAALFSNLLS